MRQSAEFLQKLKAVSEASEIYRSHNAALASNLYRQGFKNLVRDMGARPQKENGYPPRILFHDHSYILGTVPS